MAVIVDVYQDKRKTGNNLWYGRAWHPGILDTRELSKRIEQNVSVKESDVYAVLIELANVMTYELQNSNKIHLDRFGYFGVSLRSSGALTQKDWTIQDNIKNAKCIFTPEYTRTKDVVTGKSQLASRALGDVGSFQYVIKNPVPKENP
jgi:predicted histone-like DNA-binding protein